jgi:hypothetical protein
MAIELHVKLQTPTIELLVKAKDAAGNTDSIKVGFRRYELTEAQTKLEELSVLQREQYTISRIELQKLQTSLDNNNTLEEIAEPTRTSEELKDAVSVFLKGEIVYLAGIELTDTANEVSKKVLIKDTRQAKPNEPLWETPSECLDVLLDMYLASAPYRGSLIDAVQKALLNTDYKQAEQGN